MARRSASDVPAVLLVEDSIDDRQMYADYLRLNRFDVREASDTGDGLDAAPGADIVVTGIRVHGPFDGIELIRRLRADRRTSRKGIIVVTACAFDPDQQRAHAVGCDVFLTKPCLPERLLAEIRRVLQARGLQPRTARSAVSTPPGRRSA
jgi:two-component system, cell cycle response regulator DivK